jgi:hypothetical protein
MAYAEERLTVALIPDHSGLPSEVIVHKVQTHAPSVARTTHAARDRSNIDQWQTAALLETCVSTLLDPLRVQLRILELLRRWGLVRIVRNDCTSLLPFLLGASAPHLRRVFANEKKNARVLGSHQPLPLPLDPGLSFVAHIDSFGAAKRSGKRWKSCFGFRLRCMEIEIQSDETRRFG